MESSAHNAPDSFARQLLQNKILLLTVSLAVAAAVYFCVGLFFLLK